MVKNNAPDVYRVFVIKEPALAQPLYLWLTGNNKGKGASCFYYLPGSMPDIHSNVKVLEWDQVPDTQCF